MRPPTSPEHSPPGLRVEGSLRSARANAERALNSEQELKRQARRLREALSKRISGCAALFHMMDKDGNGLISKEEFHECVAALGVKALPSVVDEVFSDFDVDGSGEISYGEYVQYALRDKLRRSTTRVMECFRAFDKDGNGVVDKGEVCARTLGVTLAAFSSTGPPSI